MINLWLLYLLLWQHCTRNKNTSMLYIHSCAKCLKDEFNDKEICFLSNEEIHSDHMDFQWWFTFTVGYSRTLLVQTPDDMYWKSTCKHGYNMTMEIVWLEFTGLYSRYYGLTLYTIQCTTDVYVHYYLWINFVGLDWSRLQTAWT